MVKVGCELLLVVEVELVVELCEFQNHIDDLRLVRCVETPVFFAAENALATLEDQMGADRVLLPVERFVPGFLLRQKHDRGVVRLAGREVSFLDRATDVTPNVGGVVPVEIDNLLHFCRRRLILRRSVDARLVESCGGLRIFWVANGGKFRIAVLMTVHLDRLEVVPVCLATNDVNDLVEGCLRVHLLVGLNVRAEYTIVRNFGKGNLLRHLILRGKLSLLEGLADVASQGRLSHPGQADWYEEKLVHVLV